VGGRHDSFINDKIDFNELLFSVAALYGNIKMYARVRMARGVNEQHVSRKTQK
jgi:hypothetical protein